MKQITCSLSSEDKINDVATSIWQIKQIVVNTHSAGEQTTIKNVVEQMSLCEKPDLIWIIGDRRSIRSLAKKLHSLGKVIMGNKEWIKEGAYAGVPKERTFICLTLEEFVVSLDTVWIKDAQGTRGVPPDSKAVTIHMAPPNAIFTIENDTPAEKTLAAHFPCLTAFMEHAEITARFQRKLLN